MGAVEMKQTERWSQLGAGSPLTLVKAATAPVRIDHEATNQFPFNLPVRNLDWVAKSIETTHDASVSPSGRFSFEGDDKSIFIRRLSDGTILRTIPTTIPTWDVNSEVGPIAWSRSEDRVFVIVQFDVARALVSISVDGTSDYWERLLTDTDPPWPTSFAFVLRNSE